MTKPVTFAAIMMLLEEGKLKLDDPVSKYVPSFQDREMIATFNAADSTFTTQKATKPVLIRHLLTNTSGQEEPAIKMSTEVSPPSALRLH